MFELPEIALKVTRDFFEDARQKGYDVMKCRLRLVRTAMVTPYMLEYGGTFFI